MPCMRASTGTTMQKYEKFAKHQLLTPEEERELGIRSREGDEVAREILVTSNLRLVMFIATKKYKSYDGTLTFDDFVSEGIMGLMEGAKRYDPDKGAKFSSYTAWWIKQAIRKKVAENETPMRIPSGVGQHRNRVRAEMENFRTEFGFYPTLEEMEVIFPHMSKNRLRALMSIGSAFSLDTPISDGEGDVMGDLVADSRAATPDQILNKKGNREEIERLLECLDDRERFIIRSRFGLEGEPMTLEEVSVELRRTRERVRQIQRSALEKMRKNLD